MKLCWISIRPPAQAKRGQALHESEKLHRAIGESIQYGVWLCATDGRNTYASESFLKLTGLIQERCFESGWTEILHPLDREATTGSQFDDAE